MAIPNLNPDELSEHEKDMIKVAEAGDPNDPSEVKLPSDAGSDDKKPEDDKKDADDEIKFELPEGFESFEALVEAAKRGTADADEGDAGDSGDKDGEGNDADGNTPNEPETLSTEGTELRELKVYQEVGGEETYDKMAEFARDTLSKEEIDVYNEATKGMDESVAMLAVRGLNAMYKMSQIATFGQEGEMTHGGAGALAQGYETQSDMMKDMADPRYQSDSTFNAQVMKKVALSNF